MGEENLCSPGLLGEKVDCKPDVTHCLKTWTGKSSEMIKNIVRILHYMIFGYLNIFTYFLNFFSVETSPKTKRNCGTNKVVEHKCKDLLFGANTMLYCPCNNTNYCNSGGRLHPTNLLQKFLPCHPGYHSQPKLAIFSLVLIFHSFHHIATKLQTYLYS